MLICLWCPILDLHQASVVLAAPAASGGLSLSELIGQIGRRLLSPAEKTLKTGSRLTA